jgi:outer membrane protein assembly factor BamA
MNFAIGDGENGVSGGSTAAPQAVFKLQKGPWLKRMDVPDTIRRTARRSGLTRRWRRALLALALALGASAFAEGSETAQAEGTAAGQVTEQEASQPAAGTLGRYQGMRVRAIRFGGVSLDAVMTENLQRLVEQKVGEPLQAAKVRRSLLALYATGQFSDLRVEAEKTGENELELTFVARENYFLGEVTVAGLPRRPTGTQLVNAAKLHLGELFTEERVAEAERGMTALLEDSGYYQARVRHKVEFYPSSQQADVRFTVQAGPRARIGAVAVKGDAGYSAEEVQRVTGLLPGRTVTAERVSRGLRRLRSRYLEAHRLEAQVAVTERTYRPATNMVDYVLTIRQGLAVDIESTGTHIARSRLKKLVPVFEEGAVDDDLLNEGVRNLRNYFQTVGHFDAQASWERVPTDDERVHIVYRLDAGIKHRLLAVRFRGNRYFDNATLRERMQVRPATGLMTTGSYSEAMLDRDVAAIEALYRANGFQQVAVRRVIEDDYRGVAGEILITLEIEEGPQAIVAGLQMTGNQAFDETALRSLMRTLPGQPFSEANLASDREAVMSYYYNRGFPDVQFEAKVTPAEGQPERRLVTVKITEGEQFFVDRILVSGLRYTRPFVVSREFQIHAGEPLNQAGMLDTQRRLYDLGIFNEVDTAVQNPDGTMKDKNLLFQVREARRWTMNYGVGFQVQSGQPANLGEVNTAPAPGAYVPPGTTPPTGGVSVGTNPQGGTGVTPSVLFEVTRLNFRGRDETATLKTRYSNLQKRALLSYDAPRLWNDPNLRLTFSGFYDQSKDVRTFASQRLQGAAQIEQVLTRRGDGQPVSTLMWRYDFRRVKVDPNSLAISPELVPLLSKPVLVGMPAVTYAHDLRDDPLDPRRGSYTTVDLGVSAKALGSAPVNQSQQVVEQQTTATAANYARLLAQNSTYQQFWHGWVFARSTRVGVEQKFGSHASSLAIPLPERFFSGGTVSHRGFALNQAGPRDLTTGFPVGGAAMFINNFELRLPPPTLPWVGNNLSFVLFHDSGNVFNSFNEMTHSLFRWYQPNRAMCSSPVNYKQCRFDYMSQAAGLGVRYRTPVGPVRLDLSYNPNPATFPYFVQCPAQHAANQVPPCAAPTPVNTLFFLNSTLRHFNFFFSIGQTF